MPLNCRVSRLRGRQQTLTFSIDETARETLNLPAHVDGFDLRFQIQRLPHTACTSQDAPEANTVVAALSYSYQLFKV